MAPESIAIIVAVSIIILLLAIFLGVYLWKSESPPVVNTGAPTQEVIPGDPTEIITTYPGGYKTIQYGDEAPVPYGQEKFQPYMSVLTESIFRSDASFDEPLSKEDNPPIGNYD